VAIDDELLRKCRTIRTGIEDASVVPFLGAGANLAGRGRGGDWYKDDQLPSGWELADLLAGKYGYPNKHRNLVRVAQYAEVDTGAADLHRRLRETFTRPYVPMPVQLFLAEEQARRRSEGRPNPWKLIVTTNYDDALEQAFKDVGEEYDLVYYVAKRNGHGRLEHIDPAGRRKKLESHTKDRFELERRPVILKIHGSVDRKAQRYDSYVISEDDYIAYLAGDMGKLLPKQLLSVMRRSHILFLGYAMSDWNLRVVFFHHVWARRQPSGSMKSWAIQREPSEIDKLYWASREVNLLTADLKDWVEAMRAVAP
jgi:hypothetical protein